MFINSRIILTLSLVMLGACSAATAPTVQTGPGAEVINGNLHRVDHARTAMAYVDPDVNFDKYSQVMLDPLGADNVEIIKPNTTGSVSQRVRNADWQLSEKNIQALQAALTSSAHTKPDFLLALMSLINRLQASLVHLLDGISPAIILAAYSFAVST